MTIAGRIFLKAGRAGPVRGGIRIAREKIISILEDLGFVVEDHGTLHVVPPSWRHDVDGPADLVAKPPFMILRATMN